MIGFCGKGSQYCSSAAAVVSVPTIASSTTPSSAPAVVVKLSPSTTDVSQYSAGAPLRLTGYWYNWYDSTFTPLSSISQLYDVVIISFASISLSGELQFTPCYFGFAADVQSLTLSGKRVLLSIGGETDYTSNINNTEKAYTFASSACTILSNYGLQGVDIDLEHEIYPQFLSMALRQLKSTCIRIKNLSIQLAPQTLDIQPNHSYLTLIEFIKDIIDDVHPQFYNSGSMFGYDGGVYFQGSVDFITSQIDALVSGGHLAAHQVSIGLPATLSACGSGYISPVVALQAVQCLSNRLSCGTYIPRSIYNISGVMLWSINQDSTQEYSFASAIKSFVFVPATQVAGLGTPNNNQQPLFISSPLLKSSTTSTRFITSTRRTRLMGTTTTSRILIAAATTAVLLKIAQ